MKIRRFYSKNMRNALKQVTEEFGNDAAILSSQKTPSGVEVIAALNYDEALLPETISSLAKSKEEVKMERQSTSQGLENASLNNLQTDKLQTNKTNDQYVHQADINSASVSHLEHRQSQGRGNPHPVNHSKRVVGSSLQSESHQKEEQEYASSLASKLEWSTDPGLIGMKEELGLMRTMMKEQLDGIGWQRLAENDPIKAMLHRRLSSLGISETVREQLLPNTSLGKEFGGAESVTTNGTSVNSLKGLSSKHDDFALNNRGYAHVFSEKDKSSDVELADPECRWQQTLAQLTKSIPIDVSNIIANGGTLALLGPSGVGKTTTVTKLAARYVIKHGAGSVGLITTDSYRAAGRLQLQNFAKLLKIPVAQVTDNHSIAQLVESFNDKKLIIIDTPSLNVNDAQANHGLTCLNQYSQNNPHRPLKKLLLLPATHQHAALQQTVNQYQMFRPDSCIITKLDEAVSLGEMISLLIENKLAATYTTDGQNIPENIRVARNHHLVSKAVWLSNRQLKQNEKASIRKEKSAKQPMQAVS